MDEIREVAEEKRKLKESWSKRFINELDLIIEKCFASAKKKKEHFITREKIEIELIRLLQSQKRFKEKNSAIDIKNLCVFDKEETILGRIISINLLENTVQFENLYKQIKLKSFKDLVFIDFTTLELVSYFDKQKLVHLFFTYKDTYNFIFSKPEIKQESFSLLPKSILSK